MLSIEDLELIIKVIDNSELSPATENLRKRLEILVNQDKDNRAYQEKMENYRNELKKLIDKTSEK